MYGRSRLNRWITDLVNSADFIIWLQQWGMILKSLYYTEDGEICHWGSSLLQTRCPAEGGNDWRGLMPALPASFCLKHLLQSPKNSLGQSWTTWRLCPASSSISVSLSLSPWCNCSSRLHCGRWLIPPQCHRRSSRVPPSPQKPIGFSGGRACTNPSCTVCLSYESSPVCCSTEHSGTYRSWLSQRTSPERSPVRGGQGRNLLKTTTTSSFLHDRLHLLDRKVVLLIPVHKTLRHHHLWSGQQL